MKRIKIIKAVNLLIMGYLISQVASLDGGILKILIYLIGFFGALIIFFFDDSEDKTQKQKESKG